MRQIGSDLRSEVHTPHFTEEWIDGLRESLQPLRVQSEGEKEHLSIVCSMVDLKLITFLLNM
jgi:hypothetical protein